MNIVNVGYTSTNYYVLADTQPRLLVDIGWPGTLPQFQKQCKRMGVNLEAIPYMLATHYHPDHAGLVQELKRMGIKLLVMDSQLTAIPALKTHMKPENHYVEIDLRDNTVIALDESRAFLKKIGLNGEIIATPGHSDDSVTLVLDDGAAFTGDLPPLFMVEESDTVTRESWAKIRALNAKTIYPGHAPPWPLSTL